MGAIPENKSYKEWLKDTLHNLEKKSKAIEQNLMIKKNQKTELKNMSMLKEY